MAVVGGHSGRSRMTVGPPGGVRTQRWHYPSRAECMVCHTRAANFVLGLSELQLNKEHEYPGGVRDNQLRTFEHLGLFQPKPDPNARPGVVRVPSPEKRRTLVDPYDTSQDVNLRARSWLHANCSICHVEAGGGNAKMELGFTTAADKMRLINEPPMHDAYGLPDARLVAPGHPERSVLLSRVGRRGPGQMPPLSSNRVDGAAVELLRAWIAGMK